MNVFDMCMCNENICTCCLHASLLVPRSKTESSPKASWGSKEGPDRTAVMGMVNLLKGRVNGRNEEKKSEAEETLVIYNSFMTPAEKKDFVEQFKINGKGKTPGSLAFAKGFKTSLGTTRTKKALVKVNYYARHVCIYRQIYVWGGQYTS